MELLLKIDKEADLPKFYKDTLMKSIKKNGEESLNKPIDKVIVFPTCFVNYNNPNLGHITKKIIIILILIKIFFFNFFV